mmetsp:Transcript_8013/g.14853  ORF Transcript_8013/g.14853 Transcript_8013/m.14853 type:complete len:215 (-) Transcript_8013:120-764(-)
MVMILWSNRVPISIPCLESKSSPACHASRAGVVYLVPSPYSFKVICGWPKCSSTEFVVLWANFVDDTSVPSMSNITHLNSLSGLGSVFLISMLAFATQNAIFFLLFMVIFFRSLSPDPKSNTREFVVFNGVTVAASARFCFDFGVRVRHVKCKARVRVRVRVRAAMKVVFGDEGMLDIPPIMICVSDLVLYVDFGGIIDTCPPKPSSRLFICRK